jgi:hypothetical protein
MEIINAIDIKKGKRTKKNRFGVFTQPIQFIPLEEKDEEWAKHNLDWLEWQGVKQIMHKARRIMKNYKLAKGTIDKSDYLPEVENEMTEMLDVLTEGNNESLELKFYPLIPNIINTMVSEFAKRNTKIDYRAIDEYSYNEIMDKKTEEIGKVLLEYAQQKLVAKMVEMGMDPNSEEAQEKLNPEALKKLPEIEEFYSKKYQTLAEKWAVKQHAIDVNRFKMDELEETAFRDSLITDSEFWHFKMLEDDYDIELLNPALTYYHKSPGVHYLSQGNWAGWIDMLTIADVVDKYGYLMTAEQLESLELLHPVRSARLMIDGIPNDGSLYNSDDSYESNRRSGVDLKRHMAFLEGAHDPHDVVSYIIGQSEHAGDIHTSGLLRVSTSYWKTQRKVGNLTKVDEDGAVITEIVDENYVVTTKPIYNKVFEKKETAENLVFGDHIDWFWINQTWGGVKIGNNRAIFNTETDTDFDPIYLGIDRDKPGALRFQFRGDKTMYGCKIPIEGKVFSDRNTKSTSLVDLMKPAQIGYNLCNNQIADILVDELGSVIVLDQNAIPKHSMGEDWGKNNLAKAYVAMKDFSMLPLDPSIANTESATNFQHYQVLNLEQSQRLMSRIQLANYFKQQCMEVVGLNPQRMGQQLGQTNTATGVEQAMAGSYAQTETYFIQHSDHLMPRVHGMRTDLAQYYHSTKSSTRLQGMISPDERANFEINGTDLLLVDLNVFCMTNANNRSLLDQLKQVFMSNNTTGASVYDLGKLMQADSLGTINVALKAIETKAEEQRAQQMQAEQQAQEAEIAAKKAEKQMTFDHESREKEKDRRSRLLEAEIKAAGYGAMQDMDKNMQSDFQDVLKDVRDTEQYADTMNFNREKENNKAGLNQQKIDLDREKLLIDSQNKQLELAIAKENKNKFDQKKPTK